MGRRIVTGFSIDCDWSDPIGTPVEVAETAAFIDIRIGDRHATRAESEFSRTVTDRPLLSGYPLAIWMAASWWRLHWETLPAKSPPSDWRMSHELPAAGAGFVWPGIVFEPDGEFVRLRLSPSRPSSFEPLRYLESLNERVSLDEFERVSARFVDLVCARLVERGLRNTELHNLWNELSAERRDPELALYRRTEAILGFDPGDAEGSLVNRFIQLANRAGPGSSQEVAHAAAGKEAGKILESIIDSADMASAEGKFQVPAIHEISSLRGLHPWQRGYTLAKHVRESCHLTESSISDRVLAGLLGLEENVLCDQTEPVSARAGIAIRSVGQQAHFLFRRRRRTGRRFEAARLLSDHLLAPDSDKWLIETDAHTARQQVQRAFAAEFLCPIAALQAHLQDDLSETAIDEAAERFSVSDFIVRRQLANNRTPGADVIRF